MMKKTVFTELQKTVEKECKEGKYKLPKQFKTDWINNLIAVSILSEILSGILTTALAFMMRSSA